ncbi:ATP-binding protein [Alphaproteobacteria bacterium]|nr:ATP-binding protein [Alphaproteobacteria bacterium]
MKRNQLKYINSILRQLTNIDQKIIIFFDDFSFSVKSDDFIIFKNILYGAISRNLNFLFYATSNFRTILQYNNKSNMDIIEQQEVLDNETALSDRFGIWLGFEKFTNNQYLEIVNYNCLKFNIKYDKNIIGSKALQWSLNRGSKSGREAYHFVKSLHNTKIQY